jgi:hypothetical protein
VRNRGTQAFWAMHVEAMNWSGMVCANTQRRCLCRRMPRANGVTNWPTVRSRSTGPRICPPGR